MQFVLSLWSQRFLHRKPRHTPVPAAERHRRGPPGDEPDDQEGEEVFDARPTVVQMSERYMRHIERDMAGPGAFGELLKRENELVARAFSKCSLGLLDLSGAYDVADDGHDKSGHSPKTPQDALAVMFHRVDRRIRSQLRQALHRGGHPADFVASVEIVLRHFARTETALHSSLLPPVVAEVLEDSLRIEHRPLAGHRAPPPSEARRLRRSSMGSEAERSSGDDDDHNQLVPMLVVPLHDSFHRLMVHGVAQFLGLESKSFAVGDGSRILRVHRTLSSASDAAGARGPELAAFAAEATSAAGSPELYRLLAARRTSNLPQSYRAVSPLRGDRDNRANSLTRSRSRQDDRSTSRTSREA